MPRIRCNLTLASCAILLALLLTPALSAETLSVRMNEPFEVNNQLFENGTLTLREVSDYSPVATLNEVCVGRDCLGIFLAQEYRGSAVATENQLIFGRATDGHLVLEAVALRGAPIRELFSFEEETSEWSSARSLRGARVVQAR